MPEIHRKCHDWYLYLNDNAEGQCECNTGRRQNTRVIDLMTRCDPIGRTCSGLNAGGHLATVGFL